MIIVRHSLALVWITTVLLGGIVGAGCRPITVSDDPPDLIWTEITASVGRLPDGFLVFEGIDKNAPIRAWYARFNPTSPEISVSIARAQGEDGRERVSEIAAREKACLVVNAGYFLNREQRSHPIGLLVSDSVILNDATHRILDGGVRYDAIRAAFGVLADGSTDFAWVSSRNDSVFSWKQPVRNQKNAPAPMPLRTTSEYWPVVSAVAAGPSLFQDSTDFVTADEEIFFDSPIPNVHPRTAVGVAADGSLILMVVDGRQRLSRGVSLDELATMMRSVGAVRAINLDGGGSSAMVLNSVLMNRPVGGKTEREVASVIIVQCKQPSSATEFIY